MATVLLAMGYGHGYMVAMGVMYTKVGATKRHLFMHNLT